MISASELIVSKRDGRELSEDQLSWLIHEYLGGQVPDYQMSAFLMAVLFRGMTEAETVALTRLMLESGSTMSWASNGGPVVDKHSSGGVGDKVSLILAPLLASLGMRVPMISGRGLGSTGGTLDKLEAIPGFRTDLTMAEIQAVVDRVGCVITGATPEIAPADSRIYGLRDVTGTVPSIPLITASILSKKLAENPEALILDIKFGSGAFMKELDEAIRLGQSLVTVANDLGVRTRAVLSDMNQPLGIQCGNAHEVAESLAVLRDQGPAELEQIVIRLCAELVCLCDPGNSLPAASSRCHAAIQSGAALRQFEQMVEAQGGDLAAFEELEHQRVHLKVIADGDGYVERVQTDEVGHLINALGGGRIVVDSDINHSVGIEFLVRIGDHVQTGDTLARIAGGSADDAQRAAGRIQQCVTLSNSPVSPLPLIAGVIDENGEWHPENLEDSAT